MYGFICFLLIASGGSMLFFFPYMDHPGKTIVAGLLIALGLFLWGYRGKDANSVTKGVNAANDTGHWWMWWGN